MFTTHHVSHVSCHMLCVMRHVSSVKCNFFSSFSSFTKRWGQFVKGLLSMGPTRLVSNLTAKFLGTQAFRYSLYIFYMLSVSLLSVICQPGSLYSLWPVQCTVQESEPKIQIFRFMFYYCIIASTIYLHKKGFTFI